MPRVRPDGTHYPSTMPKICAECGEKGTASAPVHAVLGVYAHRACRVVRPTCSVGKCDEPAKGAGLCSSHYNRQYYDDRVDEQRARAKRWYQENPEKVAERYERQKAAGYHRAKSREWYWSNRIQALAIAHNQRARRLGITGNVTALQLQGRLEMFGGRCYLCGAVADGFDHVKPFSAGGIHIAANIKPACVSCNSKKGAEWGGQ